MTVDYKDTLFLPKTEFPMRAGLPKREPEILETWRKIDLWKQLRDAARGREKFILHDGPPYANGHLHIGHALNKILKDLINRSQQMLGRDANYVPGWDCHGLPIEWKIEEQYRAKQQDKDAVPINEFRQECREFAEHWIDVQRTEFKRLGVLGDWENPYLTMAFEAEALIAAELMKFNDSGQLYRGSKPVMWSVVEKTALAEAEVEYHDYESDTIWAKFPVTDGPDDLAGANIIIWTTTPWTIPGNRAVAYSPKISYGHYEVTSAPEDNWARTGDRYILADALAKDVMGAARVDTFERRGDADLTAVSACAHPLTGLGYDFTVPLLTGDHVTDEAGTGFVHTAPGHGREDFDAWTENEAALKARGIDTRIPFTVDGDGFFTADAPGFDGKRVITDKGKKGDANQAVIDALVAADALIARGRMKHQYPHSWRSKKPVIFRNTPQWFITMGDDKTDGSGLREISLKAIDETAFYPASGQKRLYGMIEQRPDWVISRQRAWGVPITVFVNKTTGEILNDPAVNDRIVEAFKAEGADAWFSDGASARFLGNDYSPDEWEKVNDILDVWFDSGSTHAFCLEQREDQQWPASLYLEGSDQHRGWFHSSLLESCGTRGRAPYDGVLTHGFVMDEKGEKMSKSMGNVTAPQEVMDQYGADILRLWVVASDYSDDLRIGPEIVKQQADTYRRLRNTFRYLLGNLDGLQDSERLDPAELPELERWVLHRLWELDRDLRDANARYDFHPFYTALHNFCAVELSAFYFDIRKDALYCDRADDLKRRAARTVLDHLFNCLTAWLAPVLCFTAEETWQARFGDQEDMAASVHLRLFPDIPADWRDDELAAKWAKVRTLRRVVTGALEIERAEKRIGASLEAAPVVHAPADYIEAMDGIDLAEISITSDAQLTDAPPPADAFTLPDTPGIGVVPAPADGDKCQRCWKVLPEVSEASQPPGTCARCGDAVAHLRAAA